MPGPHAAVTPADRDTDPSLPRNQPGHLVGHGPGRLHLPYAGPYLTLGEFPHTLPQIIVPGLGEVPLHNPSFALLHIPSDAGTSFWQWFSASRQTVCMIVALSIHLGQDRHRC
ncbi:hypothetical protein GCM10022206_05780 [Streptomyces chiangmaiensis]